MKNHVVALAFDQAGERLQLLSGTHKGFVHATDAATSRDCIFAIRRAVEIHGAENPADVVIDCGGGGGFVLDDPAAVLNGFTFTNFMTTISSSLIYAKQGVVSNIVANGVKSGSAVTDSGCFFYFGEGALMTDSSIFAITNTAWNFAWISMSAATLRRVEVSKCFSNGYLLNANKTVRYRPPQFLQ